MPIGTLHIVLRSRYRDPNGVTNGAGPCAGARSRRVGELAQPLKLTWSLSPTPGIPVTAKSSFENAYTSIAPPPEYRLACTALEPAATREPSALMSTA